MSEFLLLGTRLPGAGEVSPGRAAHDVIAVAAWHRCLRRWGLLRSFALPHDAVAGLRACLVIQASGEAAATRLAMGWERVSGYRVMALRLSAADRAGGR
jgi:hypothetical protein